MSTIMILFCQRANRDLPPSSLICMRPIRSLPLDGHDLGICYPIICHRLFRGLALSILLSIVTASYQATCTSIYLTEDYFNKGTHASEQLQPTQRYTFRITTLLVWPSRINCDACCTWRAWSALFSGCCSGVICCTNRTESQSVATALLVWVDLLVGFWSHWSYTIFNSGRAVVTSSPLPVLDWQFCVQFWSLIQEHNHLVLRNSIP